MLTPYLVAVMVTRTFQLARVTAISKVDLRLYEKEAGNLEEKKPKVKKGDIWSQTRRLHCS
jgi:hypothetical protein